MRSKNSTKDQSKNREADPLAKTIGVLLGKADDADEKSFQYRVAAGKHAIELKARFGSEYKGQLSFSAFYDRHVGRSASTVNRLIRELHTPQIADQRRERNATREQDYRNNSRAHVRGNDSQPKYKTVAKYGRASVQESTEEVEASEPEAKEIPELLKLLGLTKTEADARINGVLDEAAQKVFGPPITWPDDPAPTKRLDRSKLWRAARGFLKEFLRDGPRLMSEIQATAQQQGIGIAALRRAKVDLGIISTRQEFEQPPVWEWKLPPEEDSIIEMIRKSDPEKADEIEREFGETVILYSTPDGIKILNRGEKVFWSDQLAKVAVETLEASLPPNSYVFVCKMIGGQITKGSCP